LGSLVLVGFVLGGHELNGWGGLVGVVLVVLAQENNFIVELAGAWRLSRRCGGRRCGGRGPVALGVEGPGAIPVQGRLTDGGSLFQYAGRE
jgi:hypothetical protein